MPRHPDPLTLAGARELIGEIAPRARIPTMDEMTAHSHAVAEAHPGLVEIRTVGRSRSGEAIEMISIGEGPHDALLVGAPHPNEAIGCLTIEHFIDRLCESAQARAALPYRWHFIKAIEPDALRLNQGWFDRPDDLAHYLDHFFRPAARDQAEYGFPFDPALSLDFATTPENDAWRAAIALTRPNFVFSLHNCDYGGGFYALSREETELAAALSRQPAQLGLQLNTVGESIDTSPQYADGVYAPFDPAPFVAGGCWTAGDTGASYCERHGALEMLAEVAIWEKAGPSRIERCTAAELAEMLARQNADIVQLGESVVAAAQPEGDVAYGLVLRSAVETLDNASAASAPEFDASATDAACLTLRPILRLIGLRKVALLRRLAIANGMIDQGEDCRDYIGENLRRLTAEFPMRASHRPTMITAQLWAALTTASLLSVCR
jgi:hypothetical protein